MNPFLRPLSAAFGLGVALRRSAYRRGWLKVRRLNRPVISVGNLTVGGTGKTPLVAFIADRLARRGLRPSILTRGYGRRRGTELIEIGPGPCRDVDPRDAGDEPALLARRLPEIPILVCADRYHAGRLAEERFDVDVHLLDDGFQHFALARDADVVVFDSTQDFTRCRLLPAGPMRECFAALSRADLVVVSRVELGNPLPVEKLVGEINPSAKIFRAATRLCAILDLASQRSLQPEALKGIPLLAFCGIANPRAFIEDLRRWGYAVAAEARFRDHHVYRQVEINRLVAQAREAGATALVTTEKDAMNFRPDWQAPMKIFACVIETEVFEEEAFEESLADRIGRVRVGAR